MQTIEELRNPLNYNRWANHRAIVSLKASPNPSAQAIRALTHLLIAEKTWLLRLKENMDSTGFDFWPAASVEESETLAEEIAQSYKELVSDLTEDQLELVAKYKNSKGIKYETTYRDILVHVVMHSAYHRGQVAIAVRAEGGEPGYTDYIGFVREKQ